MNTTTSNFALAGHSPTTTGPAHWLAAITAVFERRAARRELHALSDRELADIGLSRGDIKSVFHPGFARFR